MSSHAWKLLLLLAFLAGPAWAQPQGEPPPPWATGLEPLPPGAPLPPAAEPAPAPAAEPAPAPQAPPRSREERTVFIPYAELDELLGPEGRAVVLPYEQFLELWGALSQAQQTAEEPQPPVDAVVSAARYRGRVQGSLARFEATFELTVLTDRYARLSLPLGNASVARALLDGKPALMSASGTGLELLVRGRGEHTLELEFLSFVQPDGTGTALQLGLPPVAVASLELTLPDGSLELAPAPAALEEQDGSSVARYPVGGLSAFRVVWTARAAEAAAEKPAVFLTATEVLSVGRSAVQSRSTLQFQIVQGSAESLSLRLPAGFSPLSVQVPGLRRQVRDGDVLRLELAAPVQGSVVVVLEGEQALPESGALAAPIVRAGGEVERERVYLAVLEATGLKIETRPLGLIEVDPSELPQPVGGPARVLQSFVFTAYPGHEAEPALELTVERLEAELQTDAQILLSVHADHTQIKAYLAHQIRRAGLFALRYRLPADVRVTEVGPSELVRAFRVQADAEGQVLEVELAGRAEGELALVLSAERERAADTAAVDVPEIRTLGAMRERGVVGLALEPSFDARLGESSALYPMDVRELPSSRFPQGGERPVVLAYRYNALPYAGQVLVERKQPRVTAEGLHQLTVTEDQLKLHSTLRYTILYAGVSELALEVSEDAGELVDIEGAEILEKTRAAGAPKGFTRWRVALQRPMLGSYALTVRLDRAVKEVGVGKAQLVAVPVVRAVNVAREQGFLAIGKRPNLEVEPVPAELEPLDPKELPAAARGGEVFLAYRYLKQPYALNLKVLRHEYEAVLTTIINRAHLETVLHEDGVAKTELTLEVQNNQRQYLELRLPAGTGPEGSRIQSLFVAGKAVRPARREDGTTMVRMIQSAAAREVFFIRMVYETQVPPLGTLLQRHALEAPDFLDVPVARTSWRVYLPFGYRYPWFGGSVRPIKPWAQGWAEAMSALTRDVHAPSLGVDRDIYRSKPVVLPSGKPELPEKEAAAGVLPIEVTLAAEGQSFSFSKLGGAARLELVSVESSVFYGLHFALLVLVVLACLMLPSRLGAGSGVTPARASLGCVLGAILISPFVPAAAQEALDMLFAGGVLGLLASGGLRLARWLRAGREAGILGSAAGMLVAMRSRVGRREDEQWHRVDDEPRGPGSAGAGEPRRRGGTEPAEAPARSEVRSPQSGTAPQAEGQAQEAEPGPAEGLADEPPAGLGQAPVGTGAQEATAGAAVEEATAGAAVEEATAGAQQQPAEARDAGAAPGNDAEAGDGDGAGDVGADTEDPGDGAGPQDKGRRRNRRHRRG
jgi:hypothetical protein